MDHEGMNESRKDESADRQSIERYQAQQPVRVLGKVWKTWKACLRQIKFRRKQNAQKSLIT